MLSHDVLSGNFVVLPPTGFLVPQAEKPGSPSQNNRKKGLEGEAKVLGTIQIFSSIMVTSLGLLVACTAIPHYFSSLIATLLKSGYPFVGAKCFSLSGLLVVIVAKTAEKRLTWAGLAANLLSLVAASVGLVVLIVNMAEVLAAWGLCELNAVSKMPTQDVDYSGYYSSGAGPHRCALSGSSLLGLLSVMLLFTALELCVAALAAILCWRLARSGGPGDVRFLPQSDRMATIVPRDASADPAPGFDKLVTSKERENEGDRQADGGREREMSTTKKQM
ncbi:membrane-spanning 4-domains subfamily A member 6D-like isoform X3 [Pteropus medius]|uniref:membrane-spanning 4-domains subfamily A member 6D-like isoform X3 n=1 Tax=Pteropus vampyrus TaxID=132908 RepID=UPI00196A91AB|nr:membrane-spanning 4-domains subfamily A member 6D-like isoform X3 [Pteropus giganteus]